MVHSVICPLASSKDKQELVLLEFQGSFETTDSSVEQPKIGDITFDNNTATLVVGHQRLVGKKVQLSKPFAVIKKRKNFETATMDIDDDSSQPAAYFDTVAILREKYVFAQRPSLVVQENLRGLTRIGG